MPIGLILLMLAIGVPMFIGLMWYYGNTESGRRTMAKYNSPEYEEWFQSVNPDYNPETGEWEDPDGTPYGAIDAEMDDWDLH